MRSLIYFASILPIFASPSTEGDSNAVELNKRQFAFPLYNIGLNAPYMSNGYPFYGYGAGLGPGLPVPGWRSNVADKVEADENSEVPSSESSGRLQRRQNPGFFPGAPGYNGYWGNNNNPVNNIYGSSDSFNTLSYWLNFHNTRSCSDGDAPFWQETRPWCLGDLQ